MYSLSSTSTVKCHRSLLMKGALNGAFSPMTGYENSLCQRECVLALAAGLQRSRTARKSPLLRHRLGAVTARFRNQMGGSSSPPQDNERALSNLELLPECLRQVVLEAPSVLAVWQPCPVLNMDMHPQL